VKKKVFLQTNSLSIMKKNNETRTERKIEESAMKNAFLLNMNNLTNKLKNN
jgi:hypothetical protein